MLSCLAYRIPRDQVDNLLGTITAYPLTAQFRDAWENLPAQWYHGRATRPSYSWLTTALCATTGQPVRMFGELELDQRDIETGNRMLLLTDRPVGDRLPVAVETWERHHRRDTGQPALATLLPEPELARPLARHITYRSGTVPMAPNWVWRIAAWQIMRHLAGTAIPIDGRHPLPLRIDTDGNLLGWGDRDLIRNPADTAHAMARIDVSLGTRPGIEDLVLCFDGHLSRIANRWHSTRNVWIARNLDTPILRLPVRHRRHEDPVTGEITYTHHLHEAVPKILEACDLRPIDIPHDLPTVPGDLRAQVAKNRRHPLGSGLGARFMMRLHEHITHQLPALEPLHHPHDKRIKLAPRIKTFPKTGIPANAIDSTGYPRVAIICLYATSHARSRMITQLERIAGRHLRGLPDDTPIDINTRLSLRAHHCPDLLAHGLVVNRAALVDTYLPQLDADTLRVAWVETEYHPKVPIEPELDAYRRLRRLLAHRGVPCQFLATEPAHLPAGIRPASAKSTLHAAEAALKDLLRIAGVLDHRVAHAAALPTLTHRLDRPALLIGIHARRQQTGDTDPPLILTMVALDATPDPTASWPITMYSNTDRNWRPVGSAIADFHQGAIGDSRLGRNDEKAARTRELAENRLTQLLETRPHDLPVVIFVDAQSTRTIWPGLQNTWFGDGPLPGDTLRIAGRDVAVVRCNNDVTEIGRPVTRLDRLNKPSDPLKPAAPGRKVYQLDGSTCPVWIFARVSRTYGARFGELGAKYTRWTLPAEFFDKIGKGWHSYTATEIAVAEPGTWQPVALAALTARLCEQAATWDGRVLYPTPLHYAIAADRDHPSYRTDDATEPESGDGDGDGDGDIDEPDTTDGNDADEDQ